MSVVETSSSTWSRKGQARAQRCDFDRSALELHKVPRRLQQICLGAMAARPEERPVSAEVLAGQLERFARPQSRWPWIVGGAAFLAGSVLAGLWFWRPAPGE